MSYAALIRCLLFVGAAALGGCAGSGEGLDENGRPFTSTDPQGPLTAEFASIQAHVFTPICTACHIGATAPRGLRLDAANSYSLLVGVASSEVPSILRVKPGDPDNSYLIQKLRGTAAVGAQMPFGGPPLPAATIDVIRQWIVDGAQPPPAVASAAAFKLTAAVPADGDVLSAAPKQIMLAFSHELDATRADASTVRLERIDDGDAQAAPAAVPAAVMVPAANPAAVLITVSEPLAPGRYRVTIDDRNGGISDLSGRRVADGEARAEEGTRVMTTFTVESPR